MKIKIIGGLLSFLLIVLSLLLFIRNDPTIKVITSPKVYSIMKSSNNEGFNITILTNEINSYYFNEEYISNISLSSENDEIISLSLDAISKSNENYIYNNEKYYYLSFKVNLEFSSDDYLILFDKAYLNVNYRNTKNIKLYIGEFNYLFFEEENNDISLNNLLSTHGLINGIDSSTGLFLNLGNLTNNNITINKIEIGSNSVSANNHYLNNIFIIPDYDSSVEDVLNLEDYNFNDNTLNDISKNILFLKNNEIMLYVPFSYNGDIPYLYRFYVEVHYTIDSEEKLFVIDDFPYINTNVFKVELESGYQYYEFID